MTDATAAALTSNETPPPAPASLRHGERTLKLRHVLFFHRHGDRSPILTKIGTRWTMTEEEKSFWQARLATTTQLHRLNRIARVVGDNPSMPPHGPPGQRALAPMAQLTAQGVDHMCAKGRSLRERYAVFLAAQGGVDEAPQDRVYVLSSNIDRTIQSVQCLLFGMFHTDEDINATDDVITDEEAEASQPVFHVRTYARNLLAPAHPITIFNEIEEIVKDEVAQRDASERVRMAELGEHLKRVLGIPAEQRNVPWTAIRDGLTCRKAHALSFPEGITPEMYDAMAEYDAWLWHKLFNHKPFCFGAYEHGVREVYTHLQRVAGRIPTNTISANTNSNGLQPQLSFFSAHDNSIVALISALQLQVDRILPEYGTVLTFELYEDVSDQPGSLFVRALFEGTPVAFAGHEHDPICPFEHFEARAQAFLQQ